MEKITGFIRRALGLYKNTPYQTHYMNETNIRTSMYITFVVMILEFWMMCRYVTERPGLGFWRYFDGEENYIILFLAATVLFAYSTQYIWESREYRFVMYILLASAVIDVILMTRIAVFVIILGTAFLYFYSLWAPKLYQLDMTFGGIVIEGDQINYFIYWLILSITSISIYQQGFHGAVKDEDLIKVNDIGMTVLSEGVETAEIADFLRDRGCRLLQGYHFGKPMPRAEIRQKIASGELVLKD